MTRSAFITSASLGLWLVSQSTAFAAFSDVLSTHANAQAIEYLQQRGVISGYADGTFRPDSTLNRAEFAKILDPGDFNPSGCLTVQSFPDVAVDAWYGPSVCVLKSRKIISGYADGTFKPSQQISFVEAAKIIVLSDMDQKGDTLPDTASEPWYKVYVTYLADKHAIPTNITSFDQLLTRGQMAEIRYRLLAVITDRPSASYRTLDRTDVFNRNDLVVGKQVGGMIVTALNGNTAEFDGKVTLTGMYSITGNQVCIFGYNSDPLLPTLVGTDGPEPCFEKTDAFAQATQGSITAVIAHLSLDLSGKNPRSKATLTEVITLTPQQ